MILKTQNHPKKRLPVLQASTADEKARTLAALASAPTRELVRDALEFALSPAVRSQDAEGLLAGMAAQGGAALDDTWHFVKRCVPYTLHPPASRRSMHHFSISYVVAFHIDMRLR